ncbi:MAG: hypothetical protein QOH21_2140 [Acidobacteriota bacterium]|jgi:transposase|nr:hypothetical protein [Acidobacteriota bacterium]
MATYRSRALGGGPEPRYVEHVPDQLENTCPECGTTNRYVKSNSGRPGTFIRLQGPEQFFCPCGHQWSAEE